MSADQGDGTVGKALDVLDLLKHAPAWSPQAVGLLEHATLQQRAAAQKLVTEHEMGELFKVIALGRGLGGGFVPLGFVQGDRTHRL